jgi:hypothetical protein
MTIINKPFETTKLEEDRKGDFITVRLNPEEREQLELVKRVIKQPKDGTALKQMFVYGMKNVLHDPSTSYLLAIQFKNYRNSQISGNFSELPKNDDL